MADSVADFVIQRLHHWGVRRIFGFPGDGINGLIAALESADDTDHSIDLVQVRHEELSAFMATAHAKFTGEVGVCLATSGPGAIHLLNGLYDAHMDHQGVVAIVGQAATISMGASFQQEIDASVLFKDVARYYVQTCMTPAQARHLVDRAMRIAAAERAVCVLVFPKDVQAMDAVPEPPRTHGATFSGIGYLRPRVVPTLPDLQRAADILNQGERVAILVGQGALDASAEVEQVAQILGAGVAKALLGKAVLPDDLPYVTGSIGLLGTKPSWDMMMQCDTLLMIGSGFPYAEFLPRRGQAKGVQIDIAARQLSLRYPMDVPLQGDAGETLRELIPLLRHKDDRAWRDDIEEWVRDWWKTLEGRAMDDADPINPQRVFWELSPRIPDDSILTVDTGTSTDWWARIVRIRRGMMASASGNLATMGPGVPYAIAAKFAYPHRCVVTCVGDGAMQMNGLNGLITIAKYWRQWSDPRLIVMVNENLDLNQVTWELRVMTGVPKYETSQDVPPFAYADYAEGLGLRGIFVDRPDQIGPAWDAAFAADRPVVLQVRTDPNVPPLPPHITLEQARHLAASMAGGDPGRWQVIKESVKQVLD